MDELPVTIRLLDLPLHEFLPDRDELIERLTEARLLKTADVAELELELARALVERVAAEEAGRAISRSAR